MSFKALIKSIPIFGALAKNIFGNKNPSNEEFPGSADYWENRYAEGGNSGSGSYNRLAKFKAEIINGFVDRNNIRKVIEYGCGDGNQLELANYPSYLGIDVSETVLGQCEVRFKSDLTKDFSISNTLTNKHLKADLVLSLDVIFHLVEQEVFEAYMNDVFLSSEKFVIVFSTNFDRDHNYHERDRKFTNWVEQNISGWDMIEHIPNRFPFDPQDPNNTSEADFFIYRKS